MIDLREVAEIVIPATGERIGPAEFEKEFSRQLNLIAKRKGATAYSRF